MSPTLKLLIGEKSFRGFFVWQKNFSRPEQQQSHRESLYDNIQHDEQFQAALHVGAFAVTAAEYTIKTHQLRKVRLEETRRPNGWTSKQE